MEKSELSCPAIAGLFGVAFLVGLFIWQLPASDDRSSGWAAWVQAFGSIGAIIAAISISTSGERRREKVRRDVAASEIRSFLLGVNHELDVQWRIYSEQIGTAVDPKNSYIPGVWPPPASPFKFFRSQISMIGRVPNSALRSALIEANSEFEGLFVTWKYYNGLHRRYAKEEKAFREVRLSPNAYEKALREVETYSKSVRQHHKKVSDLVKKVHQLVDAEVNNELSLGKLIDGPSP